MAVQFEQEPQYDVSSLSQAEDGRAKAQPEDWKPSGHEILIIITLAIVSLLVALDASIIVTSLGAMANELQADTTAAFWIGTSYLLVNAVTMPVIAALSEIFGRPICLEFALAAFTLGTVLCATSHSVAVMLLGRCVQGVGGGGVHVLSGVILTDIVPLRFRPKWFGVVLGAWALGTCVGPLIGGAIVQNTTWRWVFYLMFPICAYGLVAVPLLLTLAPRAESFRDKLLRVDWFGSFLFMGSATSFLVAICWGGTQKPWDSAAAIAPLVLGLLGLAATLVWEARFAREPIFKRELFNNVSSTITYVCGGAQGFLMWGCFYYFPFYFMSVMQTTPLTAGVNLLPAVLITVPGSIITGRLVTRYNNYRIFVWVGWAVAVLFSILSVVWRFIDVTTAVWAISFVFFGLGQGMVLNAQQFAVQAMCPAGDEGHAASMYLFLRQFGAAVGVGVGGSTFQNVMALKLGWEGLPIEIAAQAEGYIAELHQLPDDSPVKAKIIDAYRFGFAGVFQVYLGVAAVALLLSLLFVKHYSLDRDLGTEHVLKESKTSKMLVGEGGASSRALSGSSTAPPSRSSSNTEMSNSSMHAMAEAQPLDMTKYGWNPVAAFDPEPIYPQCGSHPAVSLVYTEYTPYAPTSGYMTVDNAYNPSRYPAYSAASGSSMPDTGSCDASHQYAQPGGYMSQRY
ncbi:hypothetical protein JX266_010676 [Neoarthrinium moseri]|nr:hypothetical protein JX266_010676 [Neoarthrinium moseri]